MKPVEPRTIGDIQPLHGLTEISLRGLDLQMVMVTHQHIGMNLKSEPGRKNAQQAEKMRIRALVREDLPLFQAAVDDVVPAAFNVEPQWPGHGQENNPPADRRNVKCLDVTPADAPLNLGQTNHPLGFHIPNFQTQTTEDFHWLE